MDRRGFLAAAGCTALTAAAGAKSPAKLEIIDTHTHFYDPTRPMGVPWPGKGDKLLYRTVLPPEYEKLARPHGVVGTVVVEASPWVEDNQWLVDLAEKDKYLVGIVGNLNPEADDFEKNLRRFARNSLYRGIRVGHDALKAGLEKGFVDRAKVLVDLNLELDVNGGPATPTDVARLAARLPKLRIVINHCANVRIDGKAVPREWAEAMKAAAGHKNVFCKVSALVESSAKKPAPRDVEFYKPVLDTLWQAFGEDRLIFGSNWPVSDLGGSFETVVGIVRDYFTTKGESAATKYFRGNAATAYAWPKR